MKLLRCLSKGLTVTRFKPTKKISSYLYGFIAGEYRTIRHEAGDKCRFPVQIHSRESKYKVM